MKNIYLLYTEKTSRGLVFFNGSYRLERGLENYPKERYPSLEGYNICTTSNDDLVVGGYHFNSKYGDYPQKTNQRDIDSRKYWEQEDYYISKIILTTDQDLITDGVQAIDDEFLEWFVENPSCEFVEVKKFAINCSCENQVKKGFGDNKIYENSTCQKRNSCDVKYEVIVPQEESKFTNVCVKGGVDLYYAPNFTCQEHPKNYKGIRLSEETLKERAFKREKEIDYNEFDWASFKLGVKRQAERSYSEEEAGELVYNIIGQYAKQCGIMIDGAKLNDLFEQFKKR